MYKKILLFLIVFLLFSCQNEKNQQFNAVIGSNLGKIVAENNLFHLKNYYKNKNQDSGNFRIFVEENNTIIYPDRIVSVDINGDTGKIILSKNGVNIEVEFYNMSDNIFKLSVESNVGFPGVSFEVDSLGYVYGQGEIGCIPILEQDCTGVSEFILNKTFFKRDPFETTEYNDVISPFWLTSKGVGVFANYYEPIKVEFNPYSNKFNIGSKLSKTFTYYLIIKKNTKEVYNTWYAKLLTGDMNNKRVDFKRDMIERITWTTWAEYKQDINQKKVLDYYREIKEHNFPIGIMEIDDKWQKEWGDTDFDKVKFPDPLTMIAEMHNGNVQVTLWVPPFIYHGSNNYNYADQQGYFVKRKDNSTYPIPWWDTGYIVPVSGMIDFTNALAAHWFKGQLNKLVTDYGVDGFKFDAGDVQFLPKDGILENSCFRNKFTDYYVEWSKEISGYEVRTAYLAQGKGVIVRQFDKNSDWSVTNGLKAVLTQTLAMSIIGYPFVLPDMIGGNEYFGKVSDKLMKRWCQLNAFLPMMQFSIKPWRDDFSDDVESVCRKAAELHMSYIYKFKYLAELANDTGEPIDKPLFFIFTDDEISYSIDDEFIFGDSILVAPLLTPSDKRDIYLPPGFWEDMNSGKEYKGPQWLKGFSVKDDEIPHFLLKK